MMREVSPHAGDMSWRFIAGFCKNAASRLTSIGSQTTSGRAGKARRNPNAPHPDDHSDAGYRSVSAEWPVSIRSGMTLILESGTHPNRSEFTRSDDFPDCVS